MSIHHQLSDSASPAELTTHARIVAAGRKPCSVLAINSGSSSLADVIDRVPSLGLRSAYVKQPFATNLSSTSNTSRSMARTCRKSEIGNGLQRIIGTSSRKLRLLLPQRGFDEEL